MKEKILSTLKEVIAKVNNDATKLNANFTRIKNEEESHVVVEISGGINGNGKWEDYFETLSKLIKVAKEEHNLKMWLVNMTIDGLDDIFYAAFGAQILDDNK